MNQISTNRGVIFCLLLVLATLALYNPATRAPFLNFDDDAYVTENPHVRAGLSWNTVAWASHSTEALNWHPITWLSHALDCQLFGLNPAGPHTVNILIHAANAALLFLILQSATGLEWRSLIVAAFFALHPMNVESVAWISERKNVLSMFFFLLTLALYGRYVRRPGIGRYLAVTAGYALALMSKPQVITLPFALLLLDYWPLRRIESSAGGEREGTSFRNLILEKIPWLALSAASAVITMKVQSDATWVRLPLAIRLENVAVAYVKYIGKAFWPLDLAPLYPYPHSISVAGAVLSAITLSAVTLLVVIFRQRRPYFVGWFWFLGTMVPMIGLVQVGVQSMADRYAYIPLLGIFVIVCWGAADLAEKWRVRPTVLVVAAATILLALGIALHLQVNFWKDNLTLWAHTLEVTQPNYIAEDNLATALIGEGRDDEALPHLQRAREVQPNDPVATLDLANYDRLHGHYQAAVDGFAKVPRLTKDPQITAKAELNSGYSHYALKQYDSARKDFEAVLRIEPQNAVAFRALGLLAQRAGDTTQAVLCYERSVAIQPTSLGYLLLAQALKISGHPDAAREAQSRAAGLTHDLDADSAIMRQLLAN